VLVTVDETIEEIQARAAAYVLGALSADDAADVEAKLAAGEARYVAEVAACRAVADDLAYAPRPQSPRPEARARLLEAIAAPRSPVVDRHDGVRFVFPEHVEWQQGVFAGVEFKILRADPDGGRVTLLTRLAPGTVYPHHRHDEFEELFLLAGDVMVNGVAMHPGDYCSAAAGSIHDGIRTLGGCTFIVSTSTRDGLFA
jgi:anti-sigma factor ChrR (cupin superfamily)